MSVQPETTRPDWRDAHAQAIADRLGAFVTTEGFGPEWKLFWRAIVDSHVDTAVADARKRLEAAIAASASKQTGKNDDGSFVTVHHSLATGRTMTTDAPNQGEFRIILDGSCERDRLATYRGFCKLLSDLEQLILAMASEITIVDAPLIKSGWILANAPHPDRPAAGLRIVIILPPPGLPPFEGHYGDCHKAAHVAVVLARLAAGKSTLVSLNCEAPTEIQNLEKAIADGPFGRKGRVVTTGTTKLSQAINPGLFRGSCHIVTGAMRDGRIPDQPFHRHMAETLISMLDKAISVNIRETYGPVEVEPGFGVTIFAKEKAAEYWRAVIDTWRRGSVKPALLPVTLDNYSELAKGALPYRTADWLYGSGRDGEERPWPDEALEAGGRHVPGK